MSKQITASHRSLLVSASNSDFPRLSESWACFRWREKKALAAFQAANPNLEFDNWPNWAQLAVHDDVSAVDMSKAIAREIPAP
jgi:hypothetical protein